MAHLLDTGAAMKDDLRCRPLAFAQGEGRLPTRAYRHMNEAARLVDEPIKFSSSVVAQRGSRTAAENSCPKYRHPGCSSAEGGVDASVERLPATIVQLWVDDPSIQAGLGCLPAGDDAVLKFEQFLACAGDVDRHIPNSCRGSPGAQRCRIRLWTRGAGDGWLWTGAPGLSGVRAMGSRGWRRGRRGCR